MDPISLDYFEQYFDDNTLSKGYKLFEGGLVVEIDRSDPEVVRATVVHGRNPVSLDIWLKDGEVTRYSCGCNESLYGLCPHLAAVLFALSEERLAPETEIPMPKKKKAVPKGEKTEKKPKAPKKKKPDDQISAMVELLPEEALRDFLLEELKDLPEFCLIFSIRFSSYNAYETKELYSGLIRKILSPYKGTGNAGIIKGPKMLAIIGRIFGSVKEQYERGNNRGTILLAAALLAEIMRVSKKIHWGYFDGMNRQISEISDFIEEIASTDLTDDEKDLLFGALMEDLAAKKLSAVQKIPIIRCAIKAAREKEQQEMLLKAIPDDDSMLQDKEKGKMAILKYRLMRALGDDNRALAYLESNMDSDEVRKERYMRYLEDGSYEAAYSLAEERMREMMTYPRWFHKPDVWKELMLKAALEMGSDSPLLIKAAKELLISASKEDKGKQRYYDLLKAAIKPEAWKRFSDEFVREARKKYLDPEESDRVIADFYLISEQWAEFVQFITQRNFVENFARYADDLPEEVRQKLYKLYAEKLIQYVRENIRPINYERLVELVGVLVNFGANDEALKVIVELKTKYRAKYTFVSMLENLKNRIR